MMAAAGTGQVACGCLFHSPALEQKRSSRVVSAPCPGVNLSQPEIRAAKVTSTSPQDSWTFNTVLTLVRVPCRSPTCVTKPAADTSAVLCPLTLCPLPLSRRTQTACHPSTSSGSKGPRVVTTSIPSGAATAMQPTSSCSERPSPPSSCSPHSQTSACTWAHPHRTCSSSFLGACRCHPQKEMPGPWQVGHTAGPAGAPLFAHGGGSLTLSTPLLTTRPGTRANQCGSACSCLCESGIGTSSLSKVMDLGTPEDKDLLSVLSFWYPVIWSVLSCK